ncbi:MAG: adenylate/guanylate cyclase domain-containing protein [Candidatus Muiribacteriota bacterium]
MASRILTVMFTDIKDFTKITEKMSRNELKELLKNHEELMYPIIKFFRGKIIKTIGDALLITFYSPINAINCAIVMQDILKKHNSAPLNRHPLIIRIALNTGEVEVTENNDIFGKNVNLASRVESITEGGEVYLTENVIISLSNTKIPLKEIGAKSFKGISNKVKIYRIDQDYKSSKFTDYLYSLNYFPPETKKPAPEPKKIKDIKKPNPVIKYFDYTYLINFLKISFIGLLIIGFVIYLPYKIITDFENVKNYPVIGNVLTLFQPPEPEEYLVDIKRFAQSSFRYQRSKEVLDKMINHYEDYEITQEAKEIVLAAYVREFLINSQYDEAIDFLYEFKKNYEFDYIDSYEIKILLPKAEFLANVFKEDEALEIYNILLDKYPHENSIIESMEAHITVEETDDTDIKADEDVFISEKIQDDKNIIIKNYEFSENNKTRINEFKRLQEESKISNRLQVEYYFMNLIYLRPVSNEITHLRQAYDIIKNLTQRDDWDMIKNSILEDDIKTVASFEFYSETTENVALLFGEHLYENIYPSLKIWGKKNNNPALRYYTFLIAQINKEKKDLDFETFHLNSLLSELGNFNPAPHIYLIKTALSYFEKNNLPSEIKKEAIENLDNILNELKYHATLSYRRNAIPEYEKLLKYLDKEL